MIVTSIHTGMEDVVQKFVDVVNCVIGRKRHHGTVVVSHGCNSVFVPIHHRKIKKVWLSINDVNRSVCCGDISKATAEIVPDGFVIYADVKSNVLVIDWMVQF